MATLKQIQQAYANPNVRKMLDLIAASEGVKHGYNTLFGNQKFANLSAHPNVRKEFTQTDGRKNYTTAAGRYQFLNGTWNNLAKRYGFRDFSPQNQDFGAIALIAGRGALQDVLDGNYQAAIKKLGKEWASLPSSTYAQGKRSWDFVNRQLGGNQLQPQLTVADLERQYGRGKNVSFEDFEQAPPNFIANLEEEYGKGVDFDFSQFDQSSTPEQKPLTIADLEAKYGEGIDYNFQG